MKSDIDQFNSRRSTVYSKNGVVATSQPLAAEAGISILRKGGNAFDAAVATAATLNVVEPPSTGIGGDAFALFRTSDGDVGALNSCGGAPAEATLDKIRHKIKHDDGSEKISMPQSGPHTVTVPGAARGWESTVEKFGNLPFREVLQPAINHAENGYPVSEVISALWKKGEDRLVGPHARNQYLTDGNAPSVGEIITLPALGNTLQKIAKNGADEFYEGILAEKISKEVQSGGGLLSVSDLAQFEPDFIDPIKTSYRDVEIFQLPPSTQGAIVLETLNIMEELNQCDLDNSVERNHYLIEAMKIGFRDGHKYISDPNYVKIPELYSKPYAHKKSRKVEKYAASETSTGYPLSDASDTVLLTAADQEGNVISFINSLYGAFGSGLVPDETGIVLHSRGGSFSLNPSHANCISPRKKPFHTLIPGLIRFDRNDWAAYGVMGGFMQPQGHVQVVSNLVDRELPLQQTLDEPRWRFLENGKLAIESRFDSQTASKLVRRGHEIELYPPNQYNEGPHGGFGGGQIVRNNQGTLSAATDPRKDGASLGY